MWPSFSSGSHRNPPGQGLLRNSPFGASHPTRFGGSGRCGQHLVRSHHDPSRGTQHAGYSHDNGQYENGQYDVESPTLVSQVGDDPGELELVAKEAMRVLRLKNAITGLVDVVGLYDAVESAMGRKSLETQGLHYYYFMPNRLTYLDSVRRLLSRNNSGIHH